MTASSVLTGDEAAYYLKVFRQARYGTLEDAEDFTSVCFALEELGCRLQGVNLKSLRKYKDSLARFIDGRRRREFSILFDLVASARNEAVHRGVFARNLAMRSTKIAIVVEEALLRMTTLVRHVMTEGVVVVADHYSLAKVRELMLENSFSYLPYKIGDNFCLVSDAQVARLWNDASLTNKQKYNTEVSKLLTLQNLIKADVIQEGATIKAARALMKDVPLLVIDKSNRLTGILAPFDLL